jgi:hypothetical protein
VGVNCFPNGSGLWTEAVRFGDNAYITFDSTDNSIVFKFNN